MLPFLKPKHQGSATGIIIKNRQSDEKPEENQEDKNAGLEASMRELHSHLQSGDYKAAAECFKDAFQQCEDEPHSEAEHIEKHSYDAQNEKAGEE